MTGRLSRIFRRPSARTPVSEGVRATAVPGSVDDAAPGLQNALGGVNGRIMTGGLAAIGTPVEISDPESALFGGQQ